MGTVILDEILKQRLKGLDEQLELRDESGKTVGRFLPEEQYLRLMHDWAKAEFAREEAEELAKGIVRNWDGTNGRTTAEAIAYLESRWQQQAKTR